MPESSLESSPFSERLESFTTLNSEVELKISDDACIIHNPWGDNTLVIRVSSEAKELIDALNGIRLPPRFTAIWHDGTKDLEFIFAPIDADNPIRLRKFSFDFKGSTFSCEYADASNSLTLIANATRPTLPPTDTNHRNLVTLRPFLRWKARLEERANPVPILTSFWVRNVDVDEDHAVSLAKHLNFYMTYFDRSSPTILIHEDPVKESSIEEPVQYPFGTFPQALQGRELDSYLLGLWESSLRAKEPFRRFLYNYQIVEYAAFYYLREEIFREVKRIIIGPDVASRIDDVARRVLDTMVEERTSDETKQLAVIQQYVDPELLWKEIQPKASFFSNETQFEGGFSLPALIKEDWDHRDFKSAWIPKLPDTLRKLRNALVHSRELRQSRSILPNARNQHLLRPWSALMSAIAMQIIIYRDR